MVPIVGVSPQRPAREHPAGTGQADRGLPDRTSGSPPPTPERHTLADDYDTLVNLLTTRFSRSVTPRKCALVALGELLQVQQLAPGHDQVADGQPQSGPAGGPHDDLEQ